ncbi:hypothetical protein ACRALDRAFT_1072819 [Sodiomyces alcalophilus JCM 7366]|uniref:uncharacterized protein n=1 Tax=Sodiomyces alcalophilus JCM 7366 TaxID=591952 RepID=UPI0039B5FF8E
MADPLDDTDSSWFPSIRHILASHPELLNNVTLTCVGCERRIRPQAMMQHPVVDLRQWNWCSLDMVGEGLGLNPGRGEEVGQLPTILPCGHIVCLRCLYRRSHFTRAQLIQKFTTAPFPYMPDTDTLELEEDFALCSDMLVSEENQQREMGSREQERAEMLASGYMTQRMFDLMQRTCPVGDCRACSSNLGYCLTDCPSWMQGVFFPTTPEELANVPLTQAEGQCVFANSIAVRPTRFPPPGRHAQTWIADMCHRCRAVREIARNMYAWNATHPTSERISICFVADPSLRAEYEDEPRFATLRALSDWMTGAYHAKVTATPWNVPPGGCVSPDARFVARQIDKPCICTVADNTWVDDEKPCDMFRDWWIWGDAVISGWNTCQGFVSRSREMGLIP